MELYLQLWLRHFRVTRWCWESHEAHGTNVYDCLLCLFYIFCIYFIVVWKYAACGWMDAYNTVKCKSC